MRTSRWFCILLCFFAVLFISYCPASADWSPLIERLVSDGFDEQAMRTLFYRPEVIFEPDTMVGKLKELIKNHSAPPPGPSRKYNLVHRALLKERVLASARAFLQENREILETVNAQYCVPKEITVSILLVETRLGRFVGGKCAFNRLASMALCTDFETIQPYLPRNLVTSQNEEFARTRCRLKADWAYAELKALIQYAGRCGVDPLGIPGSIYGAIGICQFMPTNVFSYGVDGDQDGQINLFAKPDALHSMANYLKEHGWTCSMDLSSQQRVIFTYNHSSVYVNTVLAVASKLKDSGRVKTGKHPRARKKVVG